MASTLDGEDGLPKTPPERDHAGAAAEAPSTPPLQRVRYVPDWEIPIHPPKRSLWSRTARSVRHSRLASAFAFASHKTKRPLSRSLIAGPGSADSLPKEPTPPLTIPASGPVLPTHHASPSSFHSFPHPASLNRRSFFPSSLLPAKKRTRLIVLLVVLGVIILVLSLGLGLGLGLHHTLVDLPLPDGGARVHEGELTFFRPALGACGWTNGDGDAVCAVGHEVFDAAGANADGGGNPNMNPLCGMRIRVSRQDGNGSVEVVVVDRCVGCGAADLDLGVGVYGGVVPEGGKVEGEWTWVP
ncbi:hypothetical protein QBC47DRAFT_434879 [Echria macrotheca]|uniref:RlpA-like protein double-psi beta-barrel domain-containing protein n=1 Tax=Echria macrotheca TaxID=438768 RepID=A0AAJ0B5C4_9PEZI|nr:hypothetical protein QBC47DRAFT_434879 [Echria macrotheca]